MPLRLHWSSRGFLGQSKTTILWCRRDQAVIWVADCWVDGRRQQGFPVCSSDLLKGVRTELNVTLTPVTTSLISCMQRLHFPSFLHFFPLIVFESIEFISPVSAAFAFFDFPFSPSLPCFLHPFSFLLFILRADSWWTWSCAWPRLPSQPDNKGLSERESPSPLSSTRQANRRQSQIRIMRGTLAWFDWSDAQSPMITHTHTHTLLRPFNSMSVCLFVCLCLCLLVHLLFLAVAWWLQLENLTSPSVLLSKCFLMGMLVVGRASALPLWWFHHSWNLRTAYSSYLRLLSWVVFWLIVFPNEQWKAVVMSGFFLCFVWYLSDCTVGGQFSGGHVIKPHV